MSTAPNRIVVIGQDAPLWLAANVLRAALAPAGVTVEAVELASAAGASHVHVTQPALEALHNRLGIAEQRLLRATRGSYSLGQRFIDASGVVPPFFHGHGAIGRPIAGMEFLPFWLKARAHGLAAGLDDFSLTAAAALHGRVLQPDGETERFGRTDYGYHLPAAAYARSLRTLAMQDGIAMHEAARLSVERDAGGRIAALRLDADRLVPGDLFIDASRDGILGNDAGWQRWRDAFPADRVLHARGPRMRSVPPYGQVIATDWGWASLHPSAEKTHVVAAFSAATAEEKVFDSLPSLCGFVPREVAFEASSPGQQAEPWQGNCLAIGPAAARFDPVHGVDLLALQLGLVHLIARVPVDAEGAAERCDYNRIVPQLFAHLADFQAAHYRLARYAGLFWETARSGAASPDLSHRIATFAARGLIAPYEHESFAPESWQALLLGHGVVPDRWSPSIDRVAPERMRAEFREMLGFIRDKVLAQPEHDRLLAGLAA